MDPSSEVSGGMVDPGEPDPGTWVPHETNPAPSTRRSSGIPWISLISTTYVAFWVLYQVSPEFQAWVNYTVRYWSRYPTYYAKWLAWWLRQKEVGYGR